MFRRHQLPLVYQLITNYIFTHQPASPSVHFGLKRQQKQTKMAETDADVWLWFQWQRMLPDTTRNCNVSVTSPTLSRESHVTRSSREIMQGWREQIDSSSWRPGLEHSSRVWLHRYDIYTHTPVQVWAGGDTGLAAQQLSCTQVWYLWNIHVI